MKNNVLTLVCLGLTLLLSHSSRATGSDTSARIHHEIGMDVAPLLTNRYISRDFFIPPASPGIANVIYRMHFGQSAIRLRLDYSSTNTDNSTTGTDTNSTTPSNTSTYATKNNSMALGLRLGYQYSFSTGRARFYAGVDAIIISNSGKGNNSNTNTNRNGRYDETSSETKISASGYGAAPVLGVQYRFGRHFSIGLEEFVSIIKMDGKQTSQSHNRSYYVNIPGSETVTDSKYETTTKNTEITLNPINNLSLYLSFHF